VREFPRLNSVRLDPQVDLLTLETYDPPEPVSGEVMTVDESVDGTQGQPEVGRGVGNAQPAVFWLRLSLPGTGRSMSLELIHPTL
jgi:hypothetical protein